MIEIAEFISLYQYCNYKQFKDIYGDDPYEGSERMEPYVINVNEQKISGNLKSGLFNCLMQFTNIKGAPQLMKCFSFIDSLYQKGELLLFGKDYNHALFIGLDKRSGKIIACEEDTYKYMYIAKDETAFIRFLIRYLEYEAVISKATRDKVVLKKIKEECIEIVGGGEYRAFYDVVFFIEGEQAAPIQLDLTLQ